MRFGKSASLYHSWISKLFQVEDQAKKQKSAIEYHGKYMVESNALINKNYYDNENKLFLKE